ncbi:MAG: SDR family oxidoreductase [Algisphaera sp.]
MNIPASSPKVVLVTGAGGGVGHATALLMAQAGYAVVLVGRTKSTLDAVASDIAQQHPHAITLVHVADVTQSSQVDGLVATTINTFGRIDALANCAGSAPLQAIDAMTDDIIDAALSVNLKSVLYLTRAVWPAFKKQKTGAICNVSSMASVDPFTGFNVYAAAKAGVNVFTKATADEGGQFNIIAAAVAPGAVETPMLRQHFSQDLISTDQTLPPLAVATVIRDVLTRTRPVEPGQTIFLPSP